MELHFFSFPYPFAYGRPRLHSSRDIMNAILYLLRSGCAWRLLPHDLPPWNTVYHSFHLWNKNVLWERIHTTLREHVREKMGREAQPSAGIIDSQSDKTIGLVDMTQARKSKGANVICWWTRRVSSSKPKCMLPISWIVME